MKIKTKKYVDCDIIEPISGDPFTPLSTATIEVDLGNEKIITKKSDIRQPTKDPIGLQGVPKVKQPKLDIGFQDESRVIKVNKGPFKSEYRLRGLEVPDMQYMYSGVISFYSKEKERLFFVYPKKNGKTGIASCETSRRKCHYTKTDLDFEYVDKSFGDINVIDSMNLVELPGQSNLCVDTIYYEFDEKTVLRKVSTLTKTISTSIELDSRIGVAYSVRDSSDGGIMIDFESVSSTVPLSTSGSANISKDTIEEAFESP